jgi:hypothetical protein
VCLIGKCSTSFTFEVTFPQLQLTGLGLDFINYFSSGHLVFLDSFIASCISKMEHTDERKLDDEKEDETNVAVPSSVDPKSSSVANPDGTHPLVSPDDAIIATQDDPTHVLEAGSPNLKLPAAVLKDELVPSDIPILKSVGGNNLNNVSSHDPIRSNDVIIDQEGSNLAVTPTTAKEKSINVQVVKDGDGPIVDTESSLGYTPKVRGYIVFQDLKPKTPKVIEVMDDDVHQK